VSPVRYELGFYIPEDDILHSHCRENLKSYIFTTGLSRFTALRPTMNLLLNIKYDLLNCSNANETHHINTYRQTNETVLQ
jgi:hypothetical protein